MPEVFKPKIRKNVESNKTEKVKEKEEKTEIGIDESTKKAISEYLRYHKEKIKDSIKPEKVKKENLDSIKKAFEQLDGNEYGKELFDWIINHPLQIEEKFLNELKDLKKIDLMEVNGEERKFVKKEMCETKRQVERYEVARLKWLEQLKKIKKIKEKLV